MRAGLIFFSTLVLSLAAGLGGYSLYHQRDNGNAVSQSAASNPRDAVSTAGLIGSRRADFTLNDLQGQQHSLSEWDDQVLLINFWATWCPPCRREIPTLSKLHRELSGSGFSVIGAAMDNLDKVRSYVRQHDIPYPNLAGQADVAAVSAQLGNTAGSLPYSVIIDRDGIIRYAHLGEISRDMALEQIRPLLGQQQGTSPEQSATAEKQSTQAGPQKTQPPKQVL